MVWEGGFSSLLALGRMPWLPVRPHDMATGFPQSCDLRESKEETQCML
jgi:hypothetical protein